VIGVEDFELLAALLELLDVDEDGVSRRCRDVGNVQNFQICTVSLQTKPWLSLM
jgi:hypothetical protein